MLSTFGIWITKVKIDPIEPNKLLKHLRNNLLRFKLKEVKQIGTERIVYLTLSYFEKEFVIVVELFSDGNFIICNNEMKILPVSLIAQEQKPATKVGSAIATLAKKKDALLIGSSDFTHNEVNGFAHRQDLALIEPILKLDVDEFYNILYERKVTACGYGAIAATKVASKELGATEGKLLKYATRGDVSGDKSSVVGYATIIFT